jgi:hypothetical protein
LSGSFGTPRGQALVNLAAAPVELRNTRLDGRVIGAVDTTAPLVGAAQSRDDLRLFGSLRLGALTTFTFSSPAGSPLAVLWSDQLVRAHAHPFLAQPIRMPSTAAFVAGGSGNFTLGVAIPNRVDLLGCALWLHGIGGTTLPLRLAPVVGGVVRN